jgi:hypothetical protein
MVTFDLDDFVAWLVLHEHETVGRAGLTFCLSPLSAYLQERTGRLYRFDGTTYGLASSSVSWALPRWAYRFYCLLERQSVQVSLTGAQAFDLLASIFSNGSTGGIKPCC